MTGGLTHIKSEVGKEIIKTPAQNGAGYQEPSADVG